MSMSDTDYDDEEIEQPQPKRNFRRELEERATTAEAEATRLKRENAIFKAGLTNLTERQIRTLTTELGDNLDSDAVKQIASELGWGGAPAVEETVPAEETAALDRVANASNGSSVTAKEDPLALLEQAEAEGGQAAVVAMARQLGLPTTYDQQ